MIELIDDTLSFRFPHLGPEAAVAIDFMRTLRVPDTGKTYPLPAGLGTFPLLHVEDHAARLPEHVVRRGGLLMPMWQAEAMWISFGQGMRREAMPAAVKVAAGKINAVSGEPWRGGLHRDPQDYCALPGQRWLDGFKTGHEIVRQFVAMPLGAGLTAEEQLTGAAEHGGLQLAVTPPVESVYREWQTWMGYPVKGIAAVSRGSVHMDMGLAPGGQIKQAIRPDRRPLTDYDTARTQRVFITILDAVAWRHVTGEVPPHRPPTAAAYRRAGIPWFALYEADAAALAATPALAGLTSVGGAGALGEADDDIAATPLVRLAPRRVTRSVAGWTDD